MDKSYTSVETQIEEAIGVLSQGLYWAVAKAERNFHISTLWF